MYKLEVINLVMQGLPSLQLDIVGHSGDSYEDPFIKSTAPPANNKERLQVIRMSIA